MTSFRQSMMLGAAAVAMIAPAAAQAQTYTLDIRAQSMGDALRDFARKTRQQVVFNGDTVRGMRSTAITGQFNARDALQHLIGGANLKIETGAGGVFMVKPGAVQEGNGPAAADEGGAADPKSEIVVTGTNIRGAPVTSTVINIDREEIRRSGKVTTADIIKSLPQNFGGGQQSTVLGDPTGGNDSNIGATDTVNLRGLGSGSTLVLLNGRRLPVSSIGGGVNISSIPASALDRVEVLTDGASAVYGSDAVAGVVNFVTRKDFSGAETSATIGLPTRGGGRDLRLSQLAGVSWQSGSILANYEYFDQDPLAASRRSFAANLTRPYDLIQGAQRHSALVSGTLDISSRLHLGATGTYGNLRTTGYATSFGSVNLLGVKDEQWGGAASLDYDVTPDIVATLSFSGGKDHLAQSDFVASNPSIVLADTLVTNSYYQPEFTISGAIPLINVRGAKFAVGGGLKKEYLFDRDTTGYIIAKGDSLSKYLYGELSLPIVSDGGTPGIHKLALTAAVRYETFKQFGDSTTPKFGILYAPTEGMEFHASWGRAFRVPTLFQNTLPSVVVGSTLADPLKGNALSVVLLRFSGNPDLTPETSTNLTLGVDLKPTQIPGLKLSVDFFRIDYRGRISQPVSPLGQALTNPIFAPFVQRNPTSSEIQNVIAASTGGAFIAPYSLSDVVAIVDSRYVNAARDTAKGVDLLASYERETAIGKILVSANASWLQLDQQLSPLAGTRRVDGYVFRPPSFRSRTEFSWSRGEVGASLFYNHLAGAREIVANITRRNPANDTFDAQVSYEVGASKGALSGIRLSLTAINLFDADPPPIDRATARSDAGGIEYDPTNGSALGRIFRLSLTKRW